jgi:DNA-binding NtrC family response regulator
LLGITPDALKLLMQLPFAGNVRELRNVLERSALLCDGAWIEITHLNAALESTPSIPHSQLLAAAVPAPLTTATSPRLRDMALTVLREQVRQHQGSRAELAAQLGISERSLYRKLRELDGMVREQ